MVAAVDGAQRVSRHAGPSAAEIATKWGPVFVSLLLAAGNAMYLSGVHSATSVATEKRLAAVETWHDNHQTEHNQLTSRTAAVEMRVSTVESRTASHDQKLDDLQRAMTVTNENVLAVCIATHAQCTR